MTISPPMTFAQKLPIVRALRKLSQRELARRAGVTNQTIWNIEHEKTQPRPATEATIKLALEWSEATDRMFEAAGHFFVQMLTNQQSG